MLPVACLAASWNPDHRQDIWGHLRKKGAELPGRVWLGQRLMNREAREVFQKESPPLSLLSTPISCCRGPTLFAWDREVRGIGHQTSDSSPTFITAYFHLCGSLGSSSARPSSPAFQAKWPEAGLGLNLRVNFRLGVSLLGCIRSYINKQENSIFSARVDTRTSTGVSY